MPCRAASAGARGRARAACRRAGRAGGRGDRARRAGRRRESRGRLRAARRRSPTRARRSSPARRSSGRRRPAISASTGPRRPIPTARSRRRSTAPSPRPRMSCASSWSTSAWSSPRSSRAPRPRATTPAAKHFTLRCGTQGVAGVRGQVAGAMGIKPDELRVLTDDVGGGFGMKALVLSGIRARCCTPRARSASRSIGSRRASEAFVTDNQGRDSFWTVELALNERGSFLALRVDCLGNVGAYFTGVAHFVFTTHVSGCLPTVYDIPHAQVNSRCVFTNTVPTGPYRGAGRPEASYLLERVIDAAADADRHRRRRIAPAQSDRAGENSLHHRVRQHLRQRRFPGRVRARAGACRLRRLCRAQEGGEESTASCAASASAAISRSPAPFRKKPRASRFPAAAR